MADTAPTRYLDRIGLTPLSDAAPLGGGDIGQVWRVDTQQGMVVIKRAEAYAIHAEADGLAALRAADTSLVIPEVLGIFDDVLIMEYLTPGKADATRLGEGLRELHAITSDTHGWPHDNAAGVTPQRNTQRQDGRVFQREQRLLPLGSACFDKGELDAAELSALERIANALEDWLPDAPASLLHGDLWSGNVLYSSQGPAIIDPAVYRHYPDVDIAMLELFGSPGSAFHEAYWNGGLPDDWPRRRQLFQLYPLLNHLLLFGSGYRRAVTRALEQLA